MKLWWLNLKRLKSINYYYLEIYTMKVHFKEPHFSKCIIETQRLRTTYANICHWKLVFERENLISLTSTAIVAHQTTKEHSSCDLCAMLHIRKLSSRGRKTIFM
jgi:hypothetical protein